METCVRSHLQVNGGLPEAMTLVTLVTRPLASLVTSFRIPETSSDSSGSGAPRQPDRCDSGATPLSWTDERVSPRETVAARRPSGGPQRGEAPVRNGTRTRSTSMPPSGSWI